MIASGNFLIRILFGLYLKLFLGKMETQLFKIASFGVSVAKTSI